jgi:hypothetical protein
MKKQTALNWFIDKMMTPQSDRFISEIIDQALEMERQQIIDAVDGFPIEHRNLDGADYYTQTFTEPKND